MSNWMKKGFWKLINDEMWYYKGYRSDSNAAWNMVYNMSWDNSGIIGLKVYNTERGVYEIFVRPNTE